MLSSIYKTKINKAICQKRKDNVQLYCAGNCIGRFLFIKFLVRGVCVKQTPFMLPKNKKYVILKVERRFCF